MKKILIWRTSWLLAIFCLGFTFLTFKLALLQLIRGPQLSAQADKNRTQVIAGEEIARGEIYDRFGRSLTDAGQRPAVLVFPSLVDNPKQLAIDLGTNIDLEPNSILNKLKNNYPNLLAPCILKINLRQEEIKKIQELNALGVYLIDYYSRYGPQSLAAHLIGHLGSISKEAWHELPSNIKEKYQNSDLTGAKGLEQRYERELKGDKLKQYWVAAFDARGNVLEGLGLKFLELPEVEAERSNVYLTLDRDIQAVVEEVMDEMVPVGAVVISDLASGDILAMASRPNYDQNEVFKYLQHEGSNAEFMNRSLQHYYPGSVFKTVIAAAALEEGLVSLTDSFECQGLYTFTTGLTIPCWHREGHGNLTLEEAFSQSCNPVFIELALRLGREKILNYVDKFGLNNQQLIGYTLPQFKSVSIDPNSPGKIGNAALGQEGVKLSPLQVVELISIIANDGVKVTSRVVDRVETGNRRLVFQFNPPAEERVISVKTARKLQELLKKVTVSGTGQNAYVQGFGSAGKTGSAETGSILNSGVTQTNAWFVGYAPLLDPHYSMAVLVEGGRYGNQAAAPVFRKIMERILLLEKGP